MNKHQITRFESLLDEIRRAKQDEANKTAEKQYSVVPLLTTDQQIVELSAGRFTVRTQKDIQETVATRYHSILYISDAIDFTADLAVKSVRDKIAATLTARLKELNEQKNILLNKVIFADNPDVEALLQGFRDL